MNSTCPDLILDGSLNLKFSHMKNQLIFFLLLALTKKQRKKMFQDKNLKSIMQFSSLRYAYTQFCLLKAAKTHQKVRQDIIFKSRNYMFSIIFFNVSFFNSKKLLNIIS